MDRIPFLRRFPLRMLPLLLAIALLFGACAAEPVAPSDESSREQVTSEISSASSADSDATSTPEDPIRYITCTEEDLHRGDLLLVNRTVPYDASLCEKEITDVRSARVTEIQEGSYQLPIGKKLLQTLEALQTDLQSEMQDEVCLLVNDSYRSAKAQQDIIDEYLSLYGQAYVDQYVAPVGSSEHHTSLAVDLSFYDLSNGAILATTSSEAAAHYAWVLENCRKYGLILRYTPEKESVTGYSAESWHFRYVGVPHAYYITSNALALEEYLEALKTTSFQDRLFIETDRGERYSVYYVPARGSETKVPLPGEKSYTVSGNNVDGFIVTVDESGE